MPASLRGIVGDRHLGCPNRALGVPSRSLRQAASLDDDDRNHHQHFGHDDVRLDDFGHDDHRYALLVDHQFEHHYDVVRNDDNHVDYEPGLGLSC
jgi:hypothetical protein